MLNPLFSLCVYWVEMVISYAFFLLFSSKQWLSPKRLLLEVLYLPLVPA